MFCSKCGAEISDQAIICVQCGASTEKGTKPTKDKMVAGLLAILLGTFGIHKFYLGDTKMGIIYILFCWTGITSIIGLVEGILYLTASDSEFQSKYIKN